MLVNYNNLEHGMTKYANLNGPLCESISLRITPSGVLWLSALAKLSSRVCLVEDLYSVAYNNELYFFISFYP